MRGTTQVPSVYIVLRRGGKIAFVLRSNTGFMDGKYTLPAGHVEGLETYKQAAVREVKEEVDVVVEEDDLRYLHTMQRFMGDHVRVDVLFEAAKWSGEPRNAEPALHSELVWFDAANLPFDKIMDFEANALRHILKGEQYSQFGWPAK